MTKGIAELNEQKKTCKLKLKGHATGSLEVCSGISTLVYTLAGWLANHVDDRAYTALINPGNVTISFSGGDDAALEAFKMTVFGLRQLANAHSEYFTMKLVVEK